MKKSNHALLGLTLTLLGGMVATGFILKEESAKIDLDDPLRSYSSENLASFKVLKISGSNGYPIEVEYGETSKITVLRRRKGFLKTNMRGDTLEVIFSGANIPLDQADKSTTPAGVIIQSNTLSAVMVEDTYNRIKGFREGSLNLQLAGKSSTDIINCRFSTLSVTAKNNSRFQFKEQNSADTISIRLENASLSFLKNISFSVLRHQVSDSASVVLSNQSLEQISGTGE